MLLDVRCSSCHRLLCKVDEDGIVHIKWRYGPQAIIGGSVILICPETSFNRDGSETVCGTVTAVNPKSNFTRREVACV